MKEVLIVFSIIGLVVACIVFDQYTAEERKVILTKMGIKIPVDDVKQEPPRRTAYQHSNPVETPTQADKTRIIVTGGSPNNDVQHPRPSLQPSNVDAVYLCIDLKDGKKIFSDSPCINHNADEEQRRYYVRADDQIEVYPVEKTNSQFERDKAALKRMQEERKIREMAIERRVQQSVHSNEVEQKRKETICNRLYAQKDNIKASQRQGNSDYLTKRHREVDDEIYNQKCGF